MKLYLHITRIVMSCIVLACFLTGCTIPAKEDVARSTTEFNLVAEKAGNEMLLLNIIRASKRRPMYFTSIGTLRRSMNFEYGTGGVSIPFGRIGEGLNGSYSISPSAGFSNNPVLDVSVLDTKEFTNGIMAPVPMETIEYYWSQGWHPEILLHLFIRRIEIIDQNDPNIIKEEYVNYPGDQNDFNDFQKEIRTWGIDKVTETIKIGEFDANEPTQLKDLQHLKALMEAKKAGLTITPVKEKNKAQGKSIDEEYNKTKLCLDKVKYYFTRNKKPFEDEDGTVYLRSPEAILYYLGEILRAEIKTKDPNLVMIRAGIGGCEGEEQRLFYAREIKDGDNGPFCVTVDYEKTKYGIPVTHDNDKGCCKDRTMHVLSLVSLLIGQQKKSELVPTTGVVSVIGR